MALKGIHMDILRFATAALALGACMGCSQRDQSFSATTPPHAQQDGVVLTLLGIDESKGGLNARIRVDNSTDRVLVLPASHLDAAWINAVWSDHHAAGRPSVDALSGDASWPRQVAVDQPVVMPPFTSKSFDVSFRLRPELGSVSDACMLQLKGAFENASDQTVVSLSLPKPAPHSIASDDDLSGG